MREKLLFSYVFLTARGRPKTKNKELWVLNNWVKSLRTAQDTVAPLTPMDTQHNFFVSNYYDKQSLLRQKIIITIIDWFYDTLSWILILSMVYWVRNKNMGFFTGLCTGILNTSVLRFEAYLGLTFANSWTSVKLSSIFW